MTYFFLKCVGCVCNFLLDPTNEKKKKKKIVNETNILLLFMRKKNNRRTCDTHWIDRFLQEGKKKKKSTREYRLDIRK